MKVEGCSIVGRKGHQIGIQLFLRTIFCRGKLTPQYKVYKERPSDTAIQWRDYSDQEHCALHLLWKVMLHHYICLKGHLSDIWKCSSTSPEPPVRTNRRLCNTSFVFFKVNSNFNYRGGLQSGRFSLLWAYSQTWLVQPTGIPKQISGKAAQPHAWPATSPPDQKLHQLKKETALHVNSDT